LTQTQHFVNALVSDIYRVT